MFAGQKPYPTWRQALPPPDEPDPGAGAEAKRVSSGTGGSQAPVRGGSRVPLIVFASVLAIAAMISVGLVATLALRPASAPKTAAALPPLGSGLPPLADAEVASNSSSQTVEPEPLTIAEPPIQYGVQEQASLEAAPPPASTTILPPPIAPPPAPRDVFSPLPPARPLELAPPARPLGVAPPLKPATGYDKLTAVYDISAHTVYLPDGRRLEAHSGLGDRIDDPRYVDERDRGPTPPHLYELTLRESLFHGVQALRLTPIGDGFSFNRVGLLAHPYMLGPNGDSNGCVSFKNYDAFLTAFQSGEVKRLAVVAQWTEAPRQFGVFASLGQGLNR
jgi:hypothetical protein